MSTPTLEVGAAVVTAEQARQMQAAIRAQLLRDVARLWPALDRKRLNETFPGWLRAMQLLVRSYHGQSAVAASAFYRAARAQAIQSPTPRSLIKLAPDPADEWMARAFGYSTDLMTKDTAAPNTALSTTMGTAVRIAQAGGRGTILATVVADPVAVGWYRVTDGDPCPFCALLAARFITYKSEQSASFEAHNTCGCAAAPAFSHDHAMPDINVEAARIYKEFAQRAPSGEQLPVFRIAWEARTQGDDAIRQAVKDFLARR